MYTETKGDDTEQIFNTKNLSLYSRHRSPSVSIQTVKRDAFYRDPGNYFDIALSQQRLYILATFSSATNDQFTKGI